MLIEHSAVELAMHQARRSGSLLIVDDPDDICAALCRFTSLYFQQVATAATPQEAETVPQAHQPRLLLREYRLGDEAIGRMGTNLPETAVRPKEDPMMSLGR